MGYYQASEELAADAVARSGQYGLGTWSIAAPIPRGDPVRSSTGPPGGIVQRSHFARPTPRGAKSSRSIRNQHAQAATTSSMASASQWNLYAQTMPPITRVAMFGYANGSHPDSPRPAMSIAKAVGMNVNTVGLAACAKVR